MSDNRQSLSDLAALTGAQAPAPAAVAPTAYDADGAPVEAVEARVVPTMSKC